MRRTAGLADCFSCSTASRPRLPKLTRMSVRRRNARPRSSAASDSASGLMVPPPSAWHSSLASSAAASSTVRRWPTIDCMRWPAASRSMAATAKARRSARPSPPASVAIAFVSGTADSKSPSSTRSSMCATAGSSTSRQRSGSGSMRSRSSSSCRSSAAHFGVGHRGEPRRDPLGRVVADALDVDGLRARPAELARVVGRDELVVAIRQQHLRGALPEILERRLAAERRLEDFLLRQLHQPGPAIVFADERLERLRQPRRGAALGDDRAGDERGDRLVAHPIDHRADDVEAALRRLVPLGQQLQHHFRRQMARRRGGVLQHGLQQVGARRSSRPWPPAAAAG